MKKFSTISIVSFGSALFLMCGVRLWYTMFIMLAFAVILTLIKGSATYCSNVCPMGIAMDNCGSGKAQKTKMFRGSFIIRQIFHVLFWGVIIYFIYTAEGVQQLWSNMLYLMVSVGFSSVILQELFGKRFFCVHLCPYRMPFLKGAITMSNIARKR